MMRVIERPEIGPHPDFGDSLPPLDGPYEPISGQQYVQKRSKDIVKRYSRSFAEILESVDAHSKQFGEVVKSFDELLTDYDYEHVLSSTCALGVFKPTHVALDEVGTLGGLGDTTYSPEVVLAVLEDYQESAKHVSKEGMKIRLPYGKNTGYPTPVGGTQRELSDLLLGLHASLAVGLKQRGLSIADGSEFLSAYHGPPSSIYGERYQHTAKWMPIISSSGVTWSRRFEPRVRAIFMAPKYMVAYNKPVVNYCLATLLKHPVHIQDRSVFSSTFSKWYEEKRVVTSFDIKKHDQVLGGDRGRQICRLIADVWNNGQADNLLTEFEIPLMVFHQGDCYQRTDTPILASGLSSTTVINCVGQTLLLVAVLSEALKRTPGQILSDFRSGKIGRLGWGDDCVLAFDPSDVRLLQDAPFQTIKQHASKFNVDIEEEVVDKYLGPIYGPGRLSASPIGYSTGRAIQTDFRPERLKVFPFATIGYIARLDMLGDRAETYHTIREKFWDTEVLGEYFAYSDRTEVMDKAVDKASSAGKQISQLDDVMNSIFHGILDSDLASLTDLGGDFEYNFTDLLGNLSADVTDPARFVSERGLEHYKDSISQIQQGNFEEAYPKFLDSLRRDYKLTMFSGEVIY